MIRFRKRRAVNIGILAALSVAAYLCYYLNTLTLSNGNFGSGWILLGVMIFLAAYNGRKKFPFLPLGRSSVWLQFHAYGGLLSIFLFLCHIQFRIPNGCLEIVLATLFVIVAGSGVVGLLISRSFARRLSAQGEEVIYERIPLFRRNISKAAEGLILQSVSEMQSTVLASFYREYLHLFFSRPRYFWHHIFGSREPLRILTRRIKANNRYLDESEREIMKNITELVKVKYDLDCHYALQSALKGWLFVHIPLTFALLLVAGLHVLLIYLFRGGI